VVVTEPFALGRCEGSFGKRFISELASNEVVAASWSVSTAARDVRRIDSSDGGGFPGLGGIGFGDGFGPGVGGGVGVGVGTGAITVPVTMISCQLYAISACLFATIKPNWYLPGVGIEKKMFEPHDAEAEFNSSGMIQTLLSPVASSWDKNTSVPANAVDGPFIEALRSWAIAGMASRRKRIRVRIDLALCSVRGFAAKRRNSAAL
jgi:hypothetical protein